MTSASGEERRYSDKEVKAILSRAVDISRSDQRGTGGGRGVSLAELERVAAEAGLPVEALRRAAMELESTGSSRLNIRRLFKAEIVRKRIALPKAPTPRPSSVCSSLSPIS